MSDKKYWESFYKHKQTPFESSLFARYCVDTILKSGNTVLELGCGNGRDAVYMASRGMKVLALDQCQEEITFLSDKFGAPNLQFLCADFSNLEKFGLFHAIYSRFTLHAITEEKENNLINGVANHLHPNGYLLIEARGKENEYYGLGKPVAGERNAFIYEGHYRRFLDVAEICDKIKTAKLKIISADEANGRAPFAGTDYKFIRIIAQKVR